MMRHLPAFSVSRSRSGCLTASGPSASRGSSTNTAVTSRAFSATVGPKFEQQIPFDFEFRLDDSAFYCVELTEKAFRSQGLKLSEPVKIGDWEHLGDYPLTALATPVVTKLFLTEPISLEQPVYVPGNDREGVWSSPLLETIYNAEPKAGELAAHADLARVSLRSDVDLIRFAIGAVVQVNRPTANLHVGRGDQAALAADSQKATSLTTTIGLPPVNFNAICFAKTCFEASGSFWRELQLKYASNCGRRSTRGRMIVQNWNPIPTLTIVP